ncbi:MAG: hypothetical protein AAF710_00085 [Planctomycetota bacterium]
MNPTRRPSKTLKLATAAALALTAAAPALPAAAQATPPTGPAATESSTFQDRRQADSRKFNKLLYDRNTLVRKLADLDRSARRAVLASEAAPTSLFAQQQGVEDELDAVNFRLNVLALRLGREVPSAPATAGPVIGKAGPDELAGVRVNFTRGENRTLGSIQNRAKQVLQSLDLSAYADPR